MKRKLLTLEQNLCSAKVFLNVFGLTLESRENIDEHSELNILNKENEPVGKLFFKEGKACIKANTTEGKLKAKYDMAECMGFIDAECNNAKHLEWASNIDFKLTNERKKILDGILQIQCLADSDFGMKCQCHAKLGMEKPRESNETITLMRDGSIFSYEKYQVNTRELIGIFPPNLVDSFIVHRIDNNPGDSGYSATTYYGVQQTKDPNKIQTITFQKENYRCVSNNRDTYFLNVDKRAGTIQIGDLMQEIDPSYTDTMERISKDYIINGVPLLDNLISISTSSYTDDEVRALFGRDRINVEFQDGSEDVTEAAFGIGGNGTIEKSSPVSNVKVFEKKANQ